MAPPYPLVVITPGFLVPSFQYESYAERLASWGFACVVWESPQQALDPASDVVCVSLLRDLLDWCRTAAPLGALCDTGTVLLAGHSRGAKISALAAAQDPRVRALFLVDPVDSTPWAPLSPGFPSAAAALAAMAPAGGAGRVPPVAVVGSALGGDCAPAGANYATFFDAAAGPAWEVVVREAGHLQFLDSRGGSAMDLACAAGRAPDAEVAEVARAMMVAWAETMVRGGGRRPQDQEARGGEGPASKPPPLLCGIDGEGNVVAGLASFDALQALYATEEALRGGQLSLDTRLKNFAMP
jgi:pimeloyl-ACP methyl ester carboxylesterase